MLRLANWLFDKKKDYHEGVEIYKALKIDSSKVNYFAVAKPDSFRVNMLHRALQNYARIHNIRPARSLKVVTGSPGQQFPVAPEVRSRSKKTPAIVNNPHVNYDELPPSLQNLFNENGKLNNELKSFHVKLKSIAYDVDKIAERDELCSKMVAHDAAMRSNWRVIDEWYSGGKKPIEQSEKLEPEMTDLEKDRRIKANLNYVRRYYNDGGKQEEVKKRMNELDKWAVSYAELISKITSSAG